MRNIKELLEILLTNQNYFTTGLCNLVHHMLSKELITEGEHYKLLNYINENRPTIFLSIQAFRNRNSDYFWGKGEIKPRIKWLKKHIEKLSIAEIIKLP